MRSEAYIERREAKEIAHARRVEVSAPLLTLIAKRSFDIAILWSNFSEDSDAARRYATQLFEDSHRWRTHKDRLSANFVRVPANLARAQISSTLLDYAELASCLINPNALLMNAHVVVMIRQELVALADIARTVEDVLGIPIRFDFSVRREQIVRETGA